MDAAHLLDLRSLEELKYRYTRALDHKDWELFRSCFVDDATAAYGGRLEFDSADAIVEYMSSTLGPSMITLHQVHHPELVIDGDVATGTWSLMDRVIMTEYRLLLDGASTYRDRYVRATDGWKIAHTGYERIYEHMVSMDDLPSFQMTANKFA
ncbi:MAG: nuclear transport factor 2 family protein [Acidimicrobiales bacterium]